MKENKIEYTTAREDMSEYVPTTAEVQARMVESIAGGTISVPGGYGDLARDDAENIVDAILGELAAHDAEVAAKALEDAANAALEILNDGSLIELAVRHGGYYQGVRTGGLREVERMRARAAEYRKAVESE